MASRTAWPRGLNITAYNCHTTDRYPPPLTGPTFMFYTFFCCKTSKFNAPFHKSSLPSGDFALPLTPLGNFRAPRLANTMLPCINPKYATATLPIPHFSFPCPFPPLPLPSSFPMLPLEVSSLNTVVSPPPAKCGAEPSGNRICCIF